MKCHTFSFPGRHPRFLESTNIYYLEPEYYEAYHVYIQSHLDELSEILRIKNRSFIYYAQKPASEIFNYNYPGENWITETESTFTSNLTHKLFARLGVACPNSPMLLTAYNDHKTQQGKIIIIVLEKPEGILSALKRAKEHLILNSVDLQAIFEADREYPDEDADRDFAKKAYQLTQEVAKNIEILQRYGYDKLLQEILDMHQPRLSRMYITKDYRIFLPDYGNLEIKMTPLVKAVYFLFLEFPDGITFRNLSQNKYYYTLFYIYNILSPRSDYDQIASSINQVVNYRSNSINEKCSRIREAFISEFTDNIASYYYITGNRGEQKKILLDRSLITWQGGAFKSKISF